MGYLQQVIFTNPNPLAYLVVLVAAIVLYLFAVHPFVRHRRSHRRWRQEQAARGGEIHVSRPSAGQHKRGGRRADPGQGSS